MNRNEYPYVLDLLSIHGITNRKLSLIFSKFNLPSEVFQSDLHELMETGLDNETAGRILSYRRGDGVKKQMETMDKLNIDILSRKDDDFPENIKNIPGPFFLFLRGRIKKEDSVAVAMIGTRRASEYGKVVAMKLASELAENGVTVVSGMARGIDTYSHRGALKKGRTIAVLGSGVDICYPPENKKLMMSIIEKGAVVSEYPPGTPPYAGNFPKRNRIISGLSLLVVVVEAREGSGVLHTVRWALSQNRTVLAVPGSIYSPNSVVTNTLIKEGAYPVTSVEDILSYLNIEYVRREIPHLEPQEMKLYNLIENQPLHIDEITEKMELPLSEVSLIITNLLMKGVIKELPGRRYTAL